MSESKRLVTDEEAMFLHDHVEDDVVQALLYTREALIRRLQALVDEGDFVCETQQAVEEALRKWVPALDLLNTLRGEAPEGEVGGLPEGWK